MWKIESIRLEFLAFDPIYPESAQSILLIYLLHEILLTVQLRIKVISGLLRCPGKEINNRKKMVT